MVANTSQQVLRAWSARLARQDHRDGRNSAFGMAPYGWSSFEMKLTKKDRELLTEVRNRMQEVYGTEDQKYFEYICWSLVKIGVEHGAAPKRHYESLLEYAERVGGTVKRLM